MSKLLLTKRDAKDDKRKVTLTLEQHFKLDTSNFDKLVFTNDKNSIHVTPSDEEIERIAAWILKRRGFNETSENKHASGSSS